MKEGEVGIVVKAEKSGLTLTRTRCMGGHLRGRCPRGDCRLGVVSAGNSQRRGGTLSRVKSGKLFIQRVRRRLLSKAVDLTMRDVGSVPTRRPSKLIFTRT